MKVNYLPIVILSGTFCFGLFIGRIVSPNPEYTPEKEHVSSQKLQKHKSVNRNSVDASFSRVSLFERVDTNELSAQVLLAEASSDDLENDALLLVLVSEWAKKDPYAALEYAKGIPNRSDLVYEGIRQMAKQDPDGALYWINQNVDTAGQRQYILRAAYKGMAYTDPVGAVTRVEQMSKGAQRNQLLSLTLNEWAKQDIHGAFDWIESAEITPQFKHIYNEVMGNYIEQDPVEAARLVSKMFSGSNKVSFAPQIATKLAEKDVGQALEWLETLDGDAKKYAHLGVMDRWASGENGGEALDYLLKNSDNPDYEELFSIVAVKLARKNPEELVNSFDSMSESDQKIAAHQLASVYSTDNPERGLEWIEGLENGAVKDEALKSTLYSYKNSNVSHAFVLSESISNSALRKKQMREVLKTWISVDQDAAEQALNSSRALSEEEKQALLSQAYASVKPDDYVLPSK
ncbi:MAG: hypothetical protein ACSHX7_13740 [Luteolibacter sp.]